jgi:ATPase subunit of ABC transporter with duplicated ATPase domains
VLGIEEKMAALARLELGDASAETFDVIANDWMVAERAAEALRRVGLDLQRDRDQAATSAAGVVVEPLLTRTTASLSGGELTRVRLAALLMGEPRLLLLDEPTNHLDQEGRAALTSFLASWSGGAVIASHDRALLDGVSEIWELSSKGLHVFGGNYKAYAAQRAAMDDAARQQLQSASEALDAARRERNVTRERQAHRAAQGKRNAPKAGIPKIVLGMMKRNAQATGAKLAKAHNERVANAEERLRLAKEQAPEAFAHKFDVDSSALTASKLVLELRDVELTPPGHSEPLWGEPFSADIAGPRRIALVGPNGIGKSSLLRLIADIYDGSTSGIVARHVKRIAYLDQSLAIFDQATPLIDLFRVSTPDSPEHERRVRLGRLGFSGDDALRPMAAMSGGERMRAALALTLGVDHPPELVLLDEPSSHLDLASLNELERALTGFRGAILVVSHDPRFLDAIGIEETWKLRGRSGRLRTARQGPS